ncbi:MAG TPA: hypothetical protein PK514_11340 [Spirochaetota bacterium]|nr:hypothetical protein [Spirochaetota bacterium]
MKKLSLIILLFITVKAAQSAPLAAVSYISYNSQRAHAVSVLLEQHSIEILKKYGFETVNQGLISREIEKNACFEETCMLRFASNAEIKLMITGKVEDRGDYISVTLKSFGTGQPLNGRLVLSKTIHIPVTGSLNAREFSLICEENAGLFITSTLRSFTCASPLLKKEKGYIADSPVTGRYNIYYTDNSGRIKNSGECSINKGIVESVEGDISADSFILSDFFSQAQSIEDYYAERKHEIVFQKANIYDTLFIILSTPLASATMPFAAPAFGYYTFGDWAGMGLWTVNVWPYLYLEAKGFIDSPENLKKERHDITRDDRATNYFAWYMLLAGGMPLFIDAYAHQYLAEASLFIGRQRFLGSNLTAGYLVLVSNGGGQFYKGHRGWGYFYFHLNNALLYMTLREISQPEYYDEISGTYRKGERNTDRALVYGSILAVSKIIEITHTLLTGTDLECGETVDEYIIPQPLFTLDSSGSPVYGISLTLRY